jgi:hypothetical protein
MIENTLEYMIIALSSLGKVEKSNRIQVRKCKPTSS